MRIEVTPEVYHANNEMHLSIAGTNDLVVLDDAVAGWNGLSYILEFDIPLFAANGSYFLVVNYQGTDLFDTYSIRISNFSIIGGPVLPPLDDPQSSGSENNDVTHTQLVILLFLCGICILFWTHRRINAKQTHVRSLNTNEIDRGIPKDPEKKAEDREDTDPDSETHETEEEGRGRDEVQFGEGEGENGKGAPPEQEYDGKTESDPEQPPQ